MIVDLLFLISFLSESAVKIKLMGAYCQHQCVRSHIQVKRPGQIGAKDGDLWNSKNKGLPTLSANRASAASWYSYASSVNCTLGHQASILIVPSL